MPRGYPSVRSDDSNPLHHLWCNNGSWWLHFTMHFGFRRRRIRRSLGTSDVRIAVARRDELLARLASEGEDVPERRPPRRSDEEDMPVVRVAATRPTHTEWSIINA